jgi:N-acetylmuramoyl-L-alanine amidase
MRNISAIVIHCSATPEGKMFTAKDIDAWHRGQGWNGIGYHFVIRLDGMVETGRPVEVPGSHVKNHNFDTVGLVYVGGCDAAGRKAKDTRTQAQKAAMRKLVDELLARFPGAKVCGHRDLPGVAKDCPSFDVAKWQKESAAGVRS